MMHRPASSVPAAGLRLDKLLWFLRFVRSRSDAQAWVLDGHIRLNGRRAVKPAQSVVAGDVLTLPLRSGVAVIEILTLPLRRGPAGEAAACYRPLGSAAESDSQLRAAP